MFEKVSPNLDFLAREEEVIRLWNERNVFQKQIDMRKDCDTFTFFDGPPTANGKPHIGHIETRAFKDLIPRFHAMKGKKVLRKAGCDHRRELPFHKMLLEGKLPLTIGGGIGQSRLCMLLIGCAHIGEVQTSLWDADTLRICQENNIPLL